MILEKVAIIVLSLNFSLPFFAISKTSSPQGTEIIYLQGIFGGIEINRETDERRFSFNNSTNCYELYVHLDKGDYFYPFDKYKSKPFYWDKNIISKEKSLFTANGLSWYSKYDSGDGCWFVNQTGTYHFSITYLIENDLQNFRYVWTDEYGSFIKYICNNSKQQYLLLDNYDNQSFCIYTEKDDSIINQYGLGFGEPVYNTTHTTIFGMDNKTIVNVPYDENFSSRFKITSIVNEKYTQSDFIQLSNNLIISTTGDVGDLETRNVCEILSLIENSFLANDGSDSLNINALVQENASQIVSIYNKLTASEKNKVDNSELTYYEGVALKTSKISDLMPYIINRSKKIYKTSVWTFLIPIFGVFAMALTLVLLLTFKKNNS